MSRLSPTPPSPRPRTVFACEVCGESRIVVVAFRTGGWRVSCRDGHEVFPFAGLTLLAEVDQVGRPS